MASPQWRDRLRQELRRQGLPSDYISRLVEELFDHAADISMETPSMDAEQSAAARMGNTEQLACFARSEFQRRTFAGRHPLLVFVAGPIFAVAASLILVFLVAVGGSWLIDSGWWLFDKATGGRLSANHDLVSALEMGVMQLFITSVRFVPFLMSAWVFVRLGRRTELRVWSIAACGVVALAAIFFSSVFTPATAQTKAMWMMSFGWKFGLDRILQAAVPIAFVAWMLCQRSPSRPKAIAG
jgi:hypothetical protein